MPVPTPNGPTLADLQYASYDAIGDLKVTTGQALTSTLVATEILSVRENVALNIPGVTYNVNTSDFLNTSENIAVVEGPTGPNQFSVTVSDSIKTTENNIVTGPFLPASTLLVPVNDSVTTADPAVVVEA